MPDTISATLERQAVQQLLRLARHEAKVTSSKHTRARMERTVTELETALSLGCPRCRGARFVQNPAWCAFSATLPAEVVGEMPESEAELRELEVPAEFAAYMHLYEREHGPAIVPCETCRPEAAAAVRAQTRRAA